MKPILTAAALAVGGSVIGILPASDASARLTGCTITSYANATQTSCTGHDGNYGWHRARHFCNTSVGGYHQYGHAMNLSGPSTAGYCDAPRYITGRTLLRSA